MKKIHNNNERGVALLFALGILSLMSVLGVAFVANSLTAQKTAVNINSRNHAKILLDTAVNRVMISCMAVLRQKQSAADLEKIYSSSKEYGAARGSAKDAQGNIIPDAYDNTQDLLNDPSSGMRVAVPGHPVFKMSKSPATWVYVRDKDDKVIGRMAYQVLTQSTGKSSMSLDQVLLGIYNHNDYPDKDNPPNATNTPKIADADYGKPGSGSVRSSWNSRIGKDITELNLGPAKQGGTVNDPDSGQNIPDAPFYKEWKYDTSSGLFPTNIYDKNLGYSTANPFLAASSFDAFFNGSMFQSIMAWDGGGNEDAKNAYREKQEMWFRRWFAESKDASPEVYYRANKASDTIESATPLHRFNLGKINGTPEDPWYSRFARYKLSADKDTFKNNANQVDASGKVVTYGALDELIADSADFLPEDNEVPSGVVSGLPYFRSMIYHNSNNKGSFGSVEAFRKQIAANLNDYCDADSIPTGNIPAKNWGNWVTDAGGVAKQLIPDYTGNEKTPYINELILSLKNDFKLSSSNIEVAKNATTNITGTGNVKVNISVTPSMLAELVYMYGSTVSEDYNFKAWFDSISFDVDISVDGTVNCTKSDASTSTITLTGVKSDTVNVSQDAASGTYSGTVTAAKNQFTSGYQAVALEKTDGGTAFAAVTKDIDLAGKIKDAIEKQTDVALNDISSFSVVLSDVNITIKNVKFKLPAAGLFDTAGNGVDFVRGPEADIESGGSVVFDMKASGTALTPDIQATDTLSNGWNFVYVSGIEARDPRQNLNFANPKTAGLPFATSGTDWKSEPALSNKVLKIDENGDEVGTVNIKYAGTGTNVTRSFTGKKNSCSDPSDPFNSELFISTSGTPGVDYDRENVTVTDPAWLGDEKEKHISTAFIRNAPMKSLWELGAIHRAAAWQTINLKDALGADGKRYGLHDAKFHGISDAGGIPYEYGDGGILNQVKLSPKAYTSGKLNVNMLLETHSDSVIQGWDKFIARALYYGIATGEQLSDLDKTAPPSGTISWNDTANVAEKMAVKPVDVPAPNENQYVSRADFIHGSTGPDDSSEFFPANGFGIIPYSTWANLADAQQEELVGKTANLLVATPVSSTIYALVVVQMIKSVNAPDGTVIHRPTYKNDGTLLNEASKEQKAVTKDFDIEHFEDKDVNNGKTRHRYVYFDEITGEMRALVTIRILNNPRRLQLYNIQYY